MMKLKCRERVSVGWHRYHCERDSTVERDGKCYCWQHDPEYIQAKRRKAQLEHDKDCAIREAHYLRRRILLELGEGYDNAFLEANTAKIREFINHLMEEAQ